MSKTIYITDLDGTLLDNKSLITAKSAGIITKLSQQGALISIATARTPGTVASLMEHTIINLPAITFTGAALWNCSTHSYEWTRPIDRQTADAILNILESHGINPFVYHIADDSVIDACYNGL